MSSLGSLAQILTAVGLMTLSSFSSAQTLRTRTQLPSLQEAEQTKWDGFMRYGMATDYADTREPRGYINSLFGSIGYHFDKNWGVNAEAGGRAELIDGQISKGPEQSHAETLNPSTSMELDYEDKLSINNSYSFFIHGEPLWDQASRLEGYKGLIGAGADLGLGFFGKAFTIRQTIDATELINTYHYGSDLGANPDYFYTYKLSNSLRFWKTYKLSYIFGFKTTRYLDGFWGYAYENTISLSKSWQKISVALAYDNGGFTDDGELSLWYLDQYRRVARISVNYAF